MSRRAGWAASLLLTVACGEPERVPPEPATFAEVRDDVLLTSCALSTCHGTGTGELTLSAAAPEAIYGVLVDVPSVHDPSIPRVAPGDPDGSFLVQKLEGTHANPSEDNEPMPPPFGLLEIDPHAVERVRSWIEDGAAPSP